MGSLEMGFSTRGEESLRRRVLLLHGTPLVPSVSNGCKFPGRFRVRFQPGTEPLQRVFTQNPFLKSQHFLLQLSIWVLIVSQHEQYVDCAVLFAPSPPGFRFAIRQVLVESRSKTRQVRLNTAFISQPLNEYQSDRKSECGRWKSDSCCTLYVWIMSWYDQNSNT